MSALIPARIGLLVALLAPLLARGQEAGDARARAVRLGAEGAAAYRAEKYAEALSRFSEAYRAFPAAPLLLNISRAELKLGRCAEAIRYAEQFRSAGRTDSVSPDAPEEWLSTVRRSCIDAEISSTPAGAAVWIDGERQTSPESTPWAGRLTVGRHKVLLWKSGFQKTEEPLEVTANSPAHLAVPLLPATAGEASALAGATPSAPPVMAPPAPAISAQARPPRWEPFLPAGVAVVGLVLAITGGVLSSRCPTTVGPASDVYAAEVCQYNRAGLADVGWGLAGAGAVTAGVLWLVLKPQATRPGEAPPVRVGFAANGAFLAGSF